VDERDLELRNRIYAGFVATGRPPAGLDPAALHRLHDEHALVLEQGGASIRMLNPFSCVPTAWRVQAGGRSWYANCAWDALGVCAALHADGHVSASCADCGDPLEIDVRAGRPVPGDLIFHVLVPAAQWWDDIVFT
jgi:hypothetical protein